MKNPTKLTIKQRAFVNALLKSGGKSAKAAAIEAGVPEASADSMASQWMNSPKFKHVQEEFRRLSELATDKSVLSAVWLRDYAYNALRFNPLKVFYPEKGGWFISAEDYANLPDEIGMLIQWAERQEVVRGDVTVTRYAVELVSKATMAGVAAKLLEDGEQGKGTTLPVDWDALSRRRAGEHPVEAKIRQAGEGKPKAIEDKKQQGGG